MSGVKGYETVQPWIHKGVHLPDFFRHYKGVYKGQSFDSVIPPPICFQNDGVRCKEFKDFICKTCLAEGSIKWLGHVGVNPPPRVVEGKWLYSVYFDNSDDDQDNILY